MCLAEVKKSDPPGVCGDVNSWALLRNISIPMVLSAKNDDIY
jgi:hypothetical protein